jgi:pyruvate kinase
MNASANDTIRLTKIVATLGPVSRNEPMIRAMLEKNVNVFRFNYSHAEYDELEIAYKLVRRVAKDMNKSVAILSDLQGPKFRVGRFEEGTSIALTKGQSIVFAYGDDQSKGNSKIIKCNVRQLVEVLTVGSPLLLDDGSIELTVTERLSPTEVVCRVENDGILKERKGVNVPDSKIPVPALTAKDKEDCIFALKQGTDFFALSFVQSAEDVKELRQFLAEQGYAGTKAPKIICKIEKPQAVMDIDAILDETDAIMVARGDLGVEVRPEYVPAYQKMMIQRANAKNKPVITATHMLESMINKPFPTRAEVSDVANAVYDGTDAVMLSGESAMGDYPLEAVSLMDRITREAEKHVALYRSPSASHGWVEGEKLELFETIALMSKDVAHRANAKAIVVLSYSGTMACRVSKTRPTVPVIAITPNQSVYFTSNLCFGTVPVLINGLDTPEQALLDIDAILKAQPMLKEGDTVLLCAGHTDMIGMRNSLLLYRVGEAAVRTAFREDSACRIENQAVSV